MAEEVELDTESWKELEVTVYFTAATAAVFLVIFETSRRNPAVAAVFDRRRSSKPQRTPPPLMRSRYFEWLFLSTDPAYSEYADLVHTREVIRERRRQQQHHYMKRMALEDKKSKRAANSVDGSQMSDVAVTSRGAAPSSSPGVGEVVEEEEPSFGKTSRSVPSERKKKTVPGSSAQGPPPSAFIKADRDKKEPSDSPKAGGEKRTRFNPDVVTHGKDDDENGPVDVDADLEVEGLDEETGQDSTNRKVLSIHSTDDGEVEMVETSSASSRFSLRSKRKKKYKQSRHSQLLTPDVVEVNGRRLPASIAEYAISGDLTDEQLDEYERRLIEKELEEERQFRQRQRELRLAAEERKSSNTWFRRGVSVNEEDKARSAPVDEEDPEEVDESEDLDMSGLAPPMRWGQLGFQRAAKLKKDKSFVVAGSRGRSGSGENFSEISGKASPREIEGSNGSGNKDRSLTTSRGVSSASMTSASTSSQKKEDGNAKAHRLSTVSAVPQSHNHSNVNRHLKSVAVVDRRPLSLADQELLRCVGLDAYVMIRFLRFGFDVTFYPFLLACVVLIPTYYTNSYEGDPEKEDKTGGYFRVTFNRLQPLSPRIWVAWGFAIVFFSYTLRRIWIEWETFIALRFDFLANGDAEMDADFLDTQSGKHKSAEQEGSSQKRDARLHLEQYRNSCLVEYVPESHRRDRELFEFFDAVFPGQVKRAEILLNSESLTKLIAERQKFIEKYENRYATFFHAKQQYRRKVEFHQEEDIGLCHYLCCRCCGRSPKKPTEPKVNLGRPVICCGKKMVKALPYYLSEIKRLNREIEKEHRKITEEKQKVEDSGTVGNIFTTTLGKGIEFVTGTGFELTCDTGFVEFKNLTAKQHAIQSNITGTTNFMTTVSAPDPRDINWDNATVSRETIRLKRFQVELLLFTGTFFWFIVVAFVTSISDLNALEEYLPSGLIPEEGTYWYGLVEGYLPVVALEVLMYVVPLTLRILATNYIRMKSKSEIDKFVFLWHFAYRLANLLIIIAKNQLIQSLDVESVQNDPRGAINKVAEGIAVSSQFFLNNMIVAAGSETMWELAQMPNMILHFFIFQLITVEAKSKRALERLEQPGSFEWGEVVPPFIFAFLVAAVYCTIVPLLLGACAVFFYVTTKVYTHQALFVYAQPYEGGGKLMYLLNRAVFTVIYIAISIFSALLGLKEAPIASPSFFGLMFFLTLVIDYRIHRKFVKTSITLALTNARIIDDENQYREERAQRYEEYKAAKLEKRRQAKKAALDSANGRVDEEDDRASEFSTASTAIQSGSRPPVSEGPVDADTGEAVNSASEFRVFKEDTVDEIRQRRGSEAKKSRARSSRFNNAADSDDEEDADYDFYLYRQPQLNKSLWETKPRPYR